MSMLENDSQVAEASFGASIDTFMFPGVHHTFHEHSAASTCARLRRGVRLTDGRLCAAAVSRVLFANQNRNLLACASLDTRITLTTAAAAHPQVLDRLEAHAGGVTDVCWSVTNEYLASAGLDATLRVRHGRVRWRCFASSPACVVLASLSASLRASPRDTRAPSRPHACALAAVPRSGMCSAPACCAPWPSKSPSARACSTR